MVSISKWFNTAVWYRSFVVSGSRYKGKFITLSSNRPFHFPKATFKPQHTKQITIYDHNTMTLTKTLKPARDHVTTTEKCSQANHWTRRRYKTWKFTLSPRVERSRSITASRIYRFNIFRNLLIKIVCHQIKTFNQLTSH